MRVQRKEDRALVDLVGRLIYDNIVPTQEGLDELVASGLSEVILNMDELSFLDSSALGMLLRFNSAAKSAGTKITMLSPNDQIRAVFSCTRLDQIFTIVSDDEAASITSQFASS